MSNITDVVAWGCMGWVYGGLCGKLSTQLGLVFIVLYFAAVLFPIFVS